MTRLEHARALPILLLVVGCPAPSGEDDSDSGMAESCDTADTAATGTLVMNFGFEPGEPYEDVAREAIDGTQVLWVRSFSSLPENCQSTIDRDLAYSSHPTPDTTESASIPVGWYCLRMTHEFRDPADSDYVIHCYFTDSDPRYMERCDTDMIEVLLACNRSGPWTDEP